MAIKESRIQPGTRVRWIMLGRLHCGIVQRLDAGGFLAIREGRGTLRLVRPADAEICPATPPFTCRHSVVAGYECVECARNTSAFYDECLI